MCTRPAPQVTKLLYVTPEMVMNSSRLYGSLTGLAARRQLYALQRGRSQCPLLELQLERDRRRAMRR